MPVISIVTVVHNNRPGFERTKASILSQSFRDWEWLVVDGGSVDGTAAAIEAAGESIAWWCSEPDRGIYDAMNKGLARASGEFVVFLNSGDALADADTLRVVAERIAHADASVSMICGDVCYEVTPSLAYLQRSRPFQTYLRHSMPTSHQAMYFRTTLHQEVPYDAGKRVAGDYDAVCRMFMRNANVVYLPRTLSVVWRGSESTSIRRPLDNIREAAATQRQVLGLGPWTIFRSMVKRSLPVVAFKLLSFRPLAGPVHRLIVALRHPVVHDKSGSNAGP